MAQRCDWVSDNQLMKDYHDSEWGRPEHDDNQLFERLSLEVLQAGLSWQTVLNKRLNFRRCFADFDVDKVVKMTSTNVADLMKDSSIIRNRRKLEAIITNAQAFIAVQREFETFDRYIWQFVSNQPVDNELLNNSESPAQTELSQAISKDLKEKGFKFTGPVMVYAFMQSIGMVNDHILTCSWH